MGKDVTVLETFGSSYKLNAQTQLLALEAMLANFKSDYEAIERQYPSHIAEGSPEIQLPHMLEKLKAHATKRRLAHQNLAKLSLPDVSYVGAESYDNMCPPCGSVAYVSDGYGAMVPHVIDEAFLDAMGKGKAGSKGSKGGKGVIDKKNIQCFKCLKFGHFNSECPNQVACNNCGQEGHMYKDCPKPKQQATGKGIYGPSKGGGKGHKGKGKGVNELSDWSWPDDSSPILLGQSMAIREVCLAKEAQQEESEHATRSTVTLGEFVVKESKRKTRRKTRNIRNVADETLGLHPCCADRNERNVDHLTETSENTESSDAGIWEVKVEGGWEIISVKLDTGACDWVFTPEVAKAFPLLETDNSKNKRNYQGANNSPIKNYGERRVQGFTGDECPIQVGAQIAEVSRNLASGFKIMAAGNKIVLDDEGSYIQNKASGRKIQIVNHNGEFKFEIWVPKDKNASHVKAEPKRIRKTKAADENDEKEAEVIPQLSQQKRQRVDDLEEDEDDEDDLSLLFVGQV